MENTLNSARRLFNKYKKCIWIFLISTGILYCTFLMKDNYFKILFQTISSYLIVSCLLDILKKYASDDELIKDISSGINGEIGSMKLGIKKIDINNEKEISPEKIIKVAQNRIDILHVYGFSWTRDNQVILVDALNKGVQIRGIIADFNNEVSMEFYSNHMRRDVNSKIKEVLNIWKDIYTSSKQKSNLEIYLFDGAITHAIHLNEKNVVIKSIPACKSYAKGNITTIYSEKLENGIYEQYKEEIDQIIKESKLYPLEELINKSEN